jgi:membrane associated rhomboid family serine protease
MILIPIGLNSKIKDPPFVVAAIVVVTIFISYLNFIPLREYSKDYFNKPDRQQYFYSLRTIYIKNCDLFQSKDVCRSLNEFSKNDTVQNLYTVHGELKHYFPGDKKEAVPIFAKVVSDWQNETYMKEVLEKKGQLGALNELRILSVDNDFTLKKMHLENSFYSKENPTLLALIKSQFIHSGWTHLIGNLIFFFFFGACLEQAVGRTWLLAIYFMGGTAGMVFQQFSALPDGMILMGASANIFACAGAFLRLFWRQSLRLWFSFFFVINKKVDLPTWLFFFAFVIIQQLEGLARQSGSGVAYWAHIMGFLVGGFMAHAWAKRNAFDSSSDVIFPYENDMLRAAEQVVGCEQKQNIILDLLYYSPYHVPSYKFLNKMMQACTCHPRCGLAQEKDFLATQASQLLKKMISTQRLEDAKELYLFLKSQDCASLKMTRHLTSEDTIVLGNALYSIGEREIVKELFQSIIKETTGEAKIVFEQFVDSLNREGGIKNVG